MPQIIAGLYEIERRIGAGGGGIVYLGRHIRLEKPVVLKADKRTLNTDTEALRREVDLLKGLSHTYIPQVYDFVQENGVVYTVMDFIEGESLDKLLGRREIPTQSQIIRWAGQLLEALQYLHSRPPYGILHGDIKPSNIMLRPNGDICLIDFNIALALGEEGAVKVGFSRGYASPEHYGADYISANRPAAVGRLKATEHSGGNRYLHSSQGGTSKDVPGNDIQAETEQTLKLSPEDAEITSVLGPEEGANKSQKKNASSVSGAFGQTDSKREGILLDMRSDIYSLGATLYHLLSGVRPVQDAREVEPLTADICSPAVSAILQKAMSPEPEERYQTAEEMLGAFAQLHRKDPRAVRHRRRIAASVGGLSVAFLLGVGITFLGQRQLGQIQEALTLAEYSANALAEGDVSGAVGLALQAIPAGNSILEAPVTAKAQKALTDALGVYDLSEGFKAVGTIELTGAPFDLSISPEGKKLAVVYGYEAAVYDLQSLSRIAVLPILDSALSDCLFTDEEHVVYAGREGVSCYDLPAQKIIWTGEEATTLAVSADGSTVAAVNRTADYAVLYNAANGVKKGECSFRGMHMEVAANDRFADPKDYVFALNHDGSLLAVSFSGGALTVFDLRNSDDDLLIYEESDYSRFQGGFCGRYFAFAAGGNGALFGLVDTDAAVFAGSLEAVDDFILGTDEDNVYLGSGNTLVKLNSSTLEELEIAYTGSINMTNFAVDGAYTLVGTEDNCFSFYDGGAHLMSTESENQNADFLALAGNYAVVGNRTETALRILCLESHEETKLAAYDARYPHQEARISADRRTAVIFGYQGFRVYDMDGGLLADIMLPDADHIYDQQFRRKGDDSYLEVIWYDGTRRYYDGADGRLISQESGEAPAEDLYEEFYIGDYRIASSLHGVPVVYDADSGRELAVLETDGYLTYVTEAGEYLITEYINTSGERCGLVLNKAFEPLAFLPGLCDVAGDMLVFDDGSGNLRQSRLYSLAELVALGEAYLSNE